MAAALHASQVLPASDIVDDLDRTPVALGSSDRRGLMRRILDALIESQSRRAEREIARLLGPGGLEALHRKLPPQR